MLKRLLLAVALPVLAAAPVHAQTTFFASGGDVILTPSFFPNGVVFQFFLESVNSAPRRMVISDDGTSYTLDTKGTVVNADAGSLGSLDLGFFTAGTPLIFTYSVHGQSYSVVDFYRQRVGGWDVEYADINDNSSARMTVQLRGLGAATGLQCPGALAGPPVVTCSLLDTPVTPTPEPGTIALFATGLAGLIPVAIRRRRNA